MRCKYKSFSYLKVEKFDFCAILSFIHHARRVSGGWRPLQQERVWEQVHRVRFPPTGTSEVQTWRFTWIFLACHQRLMHTCAGYCALDGNTEQLLPKKKTRELRLLVLWGLSIVRRFYRQVTTEKTVNLWPLQWGNSLPLWCSVKHFASLCVPLSCKWKESL